MHNTLSGPYKYRGSLCLTWILCFPFPIKWVIKILMSAKFPGICISSSKNPRNVIFISISILAHKTSELCFSISFDNYQSETYIPTNHFVCAPGPELYLFKSWGKMFTCSHSYIVFIWTYIYINSLSLHNGLFPLLSS